MKINVKHFLIVFGVVVGFLVSCTLLTGCAIGGAHGEVAFKAGVDRAETLGASVKRNTSKRADGTETTETTLGGIPSDDKYRLENGNRNPLY